MEAILVWGACGLFVASVVYDLLWRRVPNTLVLALLGLFAVYAALGAAGPVAESWVHLALGAVFLTAGFVFYLVGGFGAGDAKLLAVAVTWIGTSNLSQYLFGLAGCAFVLCLFSLLPFERMRRMRRELPFALAIAPPAVAVMIPRALPHGF